MINAETKKFQKIFNILVFWGIVLFIIVLIWSFFTADKSLALELAHSFETNLTQTELDSYQRIITLQNWLTNISVVSFIIGIIGKIVLKLKK